MISWIAVVGCLLGCGIIWWLTKDAREECYWWCRGSYGYVDMDSS